jgi:glycosyltransferase involved in cell wall biosynthesis
MNPRRVLIVAYYFPPIGGIGSIRLASFAAHLAEFGWEPTVIAPRRTPHPAGTELDPNIRVVRSTSIEVGRFLSRLSSRLVYPDAQIGWYPGAALSGRRLIRRERFDAVFSSSNPITAHLVARALSRRNGHPWLAEFRDPWSDWLRAPPKRRRRAAALERELARSATRLMMPTPTWASHYGRVWGKEIQALPNGHDGQIGGGSRPSRPTITHTGTFYPAFQDFRVLWTAIKRLMAEGRLEAPVLRFVGELPPELRRELGDSGLGDLVEETGFVSHREAKLLMASSSILVASGSTADDPTARGWVPAKLFEYLATPLPVLYIGAENGDAAGLLREQAGCYVVGHDDLQGVVDALEAGLSAPPPERSIEELSRRSRARQLAQILDDAAGS